MNDNDVMPSGKHKGEPIGSVPADYLLWLYENNRCTKEVKKYIETNLETLKLETKQNSKHK